MDHKNSDNGLHLVLAALETIRDAQVVQAGDIGFIKGSMEALSGPTGRITKLENTNTRQWWMHALSPLLVIAYGIARKFGVAV